MNHVTGTLNDLNNQMVSELLQEKILQDVQMGRRDLEHYEWFYRRLRGQALAYLRENSVAYKRAIRAVQDIILPAVRKHCTVCVSHCCHLRVPERKIYTRGVGCFVAVDYLLARCDIDFPSPRYENVEQNLCPFWDNGCCLPLDSRSQVCIKYFCDDIRQDLNAEKLNERIAVLDSIVQNISVEKLNQTSTRFYRGRSMSITFRPGDCLIVESTVLADIRLGDVVVYRGTNHNGEEDALVHRIVAIKPEGLVARGDNNPRPDTALVTTDNLIGQVTHVERDGKTRRVLGGRMGLWRVRAQRGRRRVWRYAWWLAARIGRKPYRRLRASGIVTRVWQPRVVKIRLNTEKGMLVKYICGGRTVARWWTQSNRFECAKPYDLVIPQPKKA